MKYKVKPDMRTIEAFKYEIHEVFPEWFTRALDEGIALFDSEGNVSIASNDLEDPVVAREGLDYVMYNPNTEVFYTLSVEKFNSIYEEE